MLSKILIHTINVRRRDATAAENAFGEIDYARPYPLVYTGIKARVETWNAEEEITAPGQRREREIIIYLEPDKVIQREDEIYFNSEFIGVVSGINNALKGSTSALDHIEIKVRPEIDGSTN